MAIKDIVCRLSASQCGGRSRRSKNALRSPGNIARCHPMVVEQDILVRPK